MANKNSIFKNTIAPFEHINNTEELDREMIEKMLYEEINNNNAMYFLRSTPFTAHSEYNYNGLLLDDFFFDNIFSNKGKCIEFCNKIQNKILQKKLKTIMLVGFQGSGKTTFINYLKKEMKLLEDDNYKIIFEIKDFDKNTSNPELTEYTEIMSNELYSLIENDIDNNGNLINTLFYQIFSENRNVILETINSKNNINNFFIAFKDVFLDNSSNKIEQGDFINKINCLYFNQILSLIILWNIANIILNPSIKKIIYCLDNLDVLVNKNILDGFFKEYFWFARNIDSIIQKLDLMGRYHTKFSYSSVFTFVFCTRESTWAKIKSSYDHNNNVIKLSTFAMPITGAFTKEDIINKRKDFISNNGEIFSEEIINDVDEKSKLLKDLKEGPHNVFGLFNNDYRQCNITIETILEDNENLLSNYNKVKEKCNKNYNRAMYGARGLIYNALFELFKKEDLLNQIGILNPTDKEPPISNARIILNYLSNNTSDEIMGTSISFEKIVKDFTDIITKDSLDRALVHMFKLGNNSSWNELISFESITGDSVDTCENLRIFITKAGIEYLQLVSTHFEFFNCRVYKRKSTALFDPQNLLYHNKSKKIFKYETVIDKVFEAVENCCQKTNKFYADIMFPKYKGKKAYLSSQFVYQVNSDNVFHVERILHTHIRYLDCFRLYLLNDPEIGTEEKEYHNKTLVNYIKKYIKVGRDNKNIISNKGARLFKNFDEAIETIEKSNYQDFTTEIDEKNKTEESE